MAEKTIKMDENELAAEVCKLEEGKVEVNIAQVKEILSCLKQLLAERSASEILVLFGK